MASTSQFSQGWGFGILSCHFPSILGNPCGSFFGSMAGVTQAVSNTQTQPVHMLCTRLSLTPVAQKPRFEPRTGHGSVLRCWWVLHRREVLGLEACSSEIYHALVFRTPAESEREADDRTEKSHGFSVTPLSNSLNLNFQGIWKLQVLHERQISERCFIFFWITNTETHSVDHDVHTEVTAEVWDYRWEEQTKCIQECKMTGNYKIVVHLRLSLKACGRRSWLSLQVHFHHVKCFRPSGWIVSVLKICMSRWRGDLATRRSSVKEPPTSRLSPFNPFCICLVFPRSHLLLNRGVQVWRGICVLTHTDGA